MSTHNICFHGEKINILYGYPILPGTLKKIQVFNYFAYYSYSKYLATITPCHICSKT